MKPVFLCDGVRTAIGRYGGGPSSVRADDLAAMPLKALLARYPSLDRSQVDDVFLGCANRAGEDNRNVARMASLLVGMPDSVSGVTLNRSCGSGVDAVCTAARVSGSGEIELAVAGSVESKSRAPFVVGKAQSAFESRWGIRSA